MDHQVSEGERDGTQRWFGGLPSVGVLPPEALTEVHQTVAARALRRVRRDRVLLGMGGVVCVFALAILVRVPALLCPVLPLLLLLASYGPGWIYRAWKLHRITHWVDDRGIRGPVERFEGHQPMVSRKEFLGTVLPERGMSTGGTGPRFLRLDVLTEVGLVLSMAERHPPRTSAPPKPLVDVAPNGLHGATVQTTSDRMAGTEQGASRPLAIHERAELTDLARHDSVWRAILPGTPALLPLLWMARDAFGARGMVFGALLAFVAACAVTGFDLLAMRRRRRQVKAAQQVATVMGGMNADGEQVEVLLPDKLLWTVGGRPAPDRLRERSRALSGDRDTPTTF